MGRETAGVRVTDVEVRPLVIPFRFGFTHALASRARTEGLLVRVSTDAGVVGVGECAPREYVTGETLAGTRAAIAGAGCVGIEVEESLTRLELPASARCGLELALLDARGKLLGRSVVQLLGPPRCEQFVYSGVVEAGEGAALRRYLRVMRSRGFRQVKLKVGRDAAADTAALAMVREVLGDVELRVDANGAWSLAEALGRLPGLAAGGVVSVEQPLPRAARADYPALTWAARALGIGVIADESVCDVEDARWFAANAGATGINLKVAKHGGISATLAVWAVARAAGLTCQLGANVGETSILAAAGRIVAGLCGPLTAYEGSYAGTLLTRDVADPPLSFGPGGVATLAEIDRPGLGLQLTDPATW